MSENELSSPETPEGSSSALSSPAGSSLAPDTPPNLHQNTLDPDAKWIVQKYGGTSVGKFAIKIAEEIVPQYLDQNRLVVVCSARSGSTKALGTTNLLIQAAIQAVPSSASSRSRSNSRPDTPGSSTPPSSFWTANNRGSDRTISKSTCPARQNSYSESPTRSLSQSLAFTILNGNNENSKSDYEETVDSIKAGHLNAARTSVNSAEILESIEGEIERDCEALKMFLGAAQVIDEISPRSKDAIIGVGEKLACKLVTAILRDRKIDAEYVGLENICPPLPAGSEDIAFDPASAVNSLPQEWYDDVAAAVAERIHACEGRIPVVTGFFGPLPPPLSLLTTIGRGYTDLLASLCAAGLQASELQIWKEVDGIFTADPRKVPTARLLSIISPEEAAELTFFGSEVVHPFTMEQVMRKSIPIRIKNVENPSGSGTVILPHSHPLHPRHGALVTGIPSASKFAVRNKEERLPTAVTYKDNIAVINVHSNKRSVSHGFLAAIFREIDRFGVTVDLLSTSEVQVSMAIQVPESELEDIPAFSKTTLAGSGKIARLTRAISQYGSVTFKSHMAILSLVGSQMASLIGMSGRMFTTLGEGGVNIEMISQGASEINISCVIKERDAVKALNLIHQSCLQISPQAARGRVGPWLF